MLVEAGAGAGASLPDEAYREAGATLGSIDDVLGAADIVVHIGKIGQDEVSRLRSGQVVIGYVWPLIDAELVQSLAAAGVTAFGMESVPRVSRAQRMDALSSQATVAGYKAVIIAAERLPALLPAADDRRRARSPRPRCSCWARASLGCKRSQPHAGWEAWCRRSTPARWSRSRSRAWVPSSWSWTLAAARTSVAMRSR